MIRAFFFIIFVVFLAGGALSVPVCPFQVTDTVTDVWEYLCMKLLCVEPGFSAVATVSRSRKHTDKVYRHRTSEALFPFSLMQRL